MTYVRDTCCLALAWWKVVVLLVTVVYHHIGSVLSAPNPCQRHLHWVIFYPASGHSKASVIDCILYNVILFESVALESCTVHTVNCVGLFDISISIVDISTLLKNIDIDINMVILKISISIRQSGKLSISISIST